MFEKQILFGGYFKWKTIYAKNSETITYYFQPPPQKKETMPLLETHPPPMKDLSTRSSRQYERINVYDNYPPLSAGQRRRSAQEGGVSRLQYSAQARRD